MSRSNNQLESKNVVSANAISSSDAFQPVNNSSNQPASEQVISANKLSWSDIPPPVVRNSIILLMNRQEIVRLAVTCRSFIPYLSDKRMWEHLLDTESQKSNNYNLTTLFSDRETHLAYVFGVASYNPFASKTNWQNGRMTGYTDVSLRVSSGQYKQVKFVIDNMQYGDGYHHRLLPRIGGNSNISILESVLLKKDLLAIQYVLLHLKNNNNVMNVSTLDVHHHFLLVELIKVIHLAILQKDLVLIKLIVDYLKFIPKDYHEDKTNRNLLHFAAATGDMTIIQYLESKQCFFHADQKGITPLHLAAENGHEEATEHFRKSFKSALYKCRDHRGLTPAHYAAKKGHLSIVKKLIGDSKKLNQYTAENGVSLLHASVADINTFLFILSLGKFDCKAILPATGGTLLHLAAAANQDGKVVKLLVEEYGLRTSKDHFGRSPLYYAALHNNEVVFRYLLNNNFTPTKEDNELNKVRDFVTRPQPAVKAASDPGDSKRVPEANNNSQRTSELPKNASSPVSGSEVVISPFTQWNEDDYAGLLSMVSRGDIDQLTDYKNYFSKMRMWSKNPWKAVVSPSGGTILHFAVEAQNSVDKLSQFQALTNISWHCQDSDESSLLHVAAQMGNYDVYDDLVKNKKMEKKHYRNKHGNTPLHLAAQYGHLRMVTYCVESTPALKLHECKNQYNETPLFSAVSKDQVAIVEYLVKIKNKQGKSVDLLKTRNDEGGTVAHFSVEHDARKCLTFFGEQHDMMQFRRQMNASWGSDESLLHTAVRFGRLDILVMLLKKYNKMNFADCVDDKKRNLKQLHLERMKIESGSLNSEKLSVHATIGKILMLHSKGNSNDTMLHELVENKQHFEVQYLMDNFNKDVNMRNRLNQAPLHIAAKAWSVSEVKKFIQDYKPQIDCLDKQKRTVLHQAAYNEDRIEMMRYFIEEHKMDIYQTDLSGKNILHTVIERGDIDAMKFLIQKCKMDINRLNSSGNNILHKVAECGNVKAIEFLVDECKMSINQKDQRGNTLLHVAANAGNLEAVVWLVQRGLALTAQNHSGVIPIYFTQFINSPEICKTVVDVMSKLTWIRASQYEDRLKYIDTSLLINTLKTLIGKDEKAVIDAIEKLDTVVAPPAIVNNNGPMFRS